jgi:hypothetical protein
MTKIDFHMEKENVVKGPGRIISISTVRSVSSVFSAKSAAIKVCNLRMRLPGIRIDRARETTPREGA